jgi:hypothetical protein
MTTFTCRWWPRLIRWLGNGKYVSVAIAIAGISATPTHQPPGTEVAKLELQ